MKKYYYCLFSLFLLIFTSCTTPSKDKASIVKWVDSVITENTNYHSNNLVKKEVAKDVEKYANKCIGNNTSIMEGVTFRLAKVIEEKDSCIVIFDASSCISDIAKEDNGHIITDIIIRVLGKVDNKTASALDGDADYNISGIVHEWDKEDRFFASKSSIDYIDFGTFILNSDITIKKVENE